MQPPLAALWIGSELSFVEVLCLKSMLAMGHDVTLFTYQEVKNVPAGVTQRDAREIWDTQALVLHKRTGSPAPHADIFRLKMLVNTDYTWIDADMLLLKPARVNDGYLFGFESKTSIGNSILKLPMDSAALRLCLQFIDSFLGSKKVDCHLRDAFDTGIAGHAYEMHIATLGPHLLTKALNSTDEIERAPAKDVFYPVEISSANLLTKRKLRVFNKLTANTVGVHLWSSRLKHAIARRQKLNNNSLSFLKTSFIGRQCAEYDVDYLAMLASPLTDFRHRDQHEMRRIS